MSAMDEAKAQLGLGYYQPSAVLNYVFCPRCRERITTHVVAWAKPRERSAALIHALSAHITEEHPS